MEVTSSLEAGSANSGALLKVIPLIHQIIHYIPDIYEICPLINMEIYEYIFIT